MIRALTALQFVLATVVPNGDRRCWGVGPNYWRTFDGMEFLFSGRCVYTLFSDGLCTVTVDMSRCTSFSNCRKVSELHSCTGAHLWGFASAIPSLKVKIVENIGSLLSKLLPYVVYFYILFVFFYYFIFQRLYTMAPLCYG